MGQVEAETSCKCSAHAWNEQEKSHKDFGISRVPHSDTSCQLSSARKWGSEMTWPAKSDK